MNNFLDKAPSQYAGGVFANMLGYNVIRTVYLNIWRMKPKKVKEEFQKYADTLHKDGIVVIPNFFPQEQFDAIKKEYEEIYSGWSPFDYSSDDMTKRQKDFPEYFKTIAEKITSPKTPAYTNYFVNNEMIKEIASAVVHRKHRTPSFHHLWYLQRRTLEKKNVGNLHSAGYPHADVPYPTIKVFLYLNDVDESNAAYIFARGSHKMTLKRLWFEYKLSVRYAKSHEDLGTDEDISKLGFYPESIKGKANTLIISNNMGYHNRGDFSTLQPRITAQLDFRNLETWRNILSRNDSGLFSKISRRIVKSLDKAKKEKLRASFSHNNVS